MTSVNAEQSQLSKWVLGLLMVSMSMLSTQLYAAPATIELFSSGGGTDTTAKLTASTDSHTYQLNLNNPTDDTAATYTPTASVSYQITSSVFNSVRYNSATNPATSPNVVFGGGVTTAADPANSFVSPNAVYVPLNTIGSATDTAFAATLQNGNTCPTTGNCASTSGGISAANNYGTRLLIATRGFNAGGVSTSTGSTPGQLGTKVGTVVVTFNRPVTNPIIHVAGLGGASTSGSTLGFSGQLQLTGSTHATGGSGAVPSRIAGSAELSVQGSNILNVATNPRATTGSGGASGSVLITGRRINTLTFDVYIRGDGGLAQWSEQGGEAFFLGASSIEADNDLSIVKSQRIGSSGTFVQSQINGTQFDLIQYRLVLTNNSTIKEVSGAQLSDTLPASLTNTSLVSTNTTGTGTVCSPTLTGNSLTSTFSGPIGATCTIIVQGYASTAGTVTNTASVLENATDPDTVNNSSVVNAIISAPATISPDPTINEARFTIVPDLPTIYRGGTGTQLVTITNNGPSNATGTIATFIPAPQTGVSVTAVNVVGGAACTFASGEWSCPVGNVSNAANFQLNVSYSTTSASALGTAQQATIKVRSNEFNPGSGVGETLYKVWGSNQQNEIRPNGAFWVGYTGTGGSAQVGTNTDENTPITSAWPETQASPTGAYLTQAAIGVPNSVYGASSTTASPMIQRIITNLSTDPDRTVTLPQLNNTTQAGDNRRAWEYRTGIYVPTAQSVTLCVGNTSVGIDDGAYIVVDGVVQGVQDSYVPGGYVTASLSLSAGYHSISYRIANQNTYSAGGNAESSAGAYGAIGISLGATCNTANFDTWTNTAVPASINIIDGVDLQITKTNSVTAVNAGGTTAYTVVVTNAGPSAANGAFFRDVAATGLSKTSITCSAAGGAVCPTAPISIATVEGASGIAIPTFPSGGSVTFTVNTNVTAVSGSVSNVATTTVPAGVTEINAANNSATDTDTVTLVADLSISKTDGVTSVNAGSSTSYTIVVNNAGPSAADGALFRDAAATGLNKTSITCSASGGAVCPTAPISIATVEGASGIAIPTLPSSGSVSFTVVASVTASSGSVANTATIAAPAGTTDNNAANNSATDTDTVNPIADLSISKSDGVTSVNAGSSTSYTIVVNNAGPSAANGALFRDVAATGLNKTSITCSAAGGAVCPTAPISIATVEGASGIAIPTLPSGGSVTFTVVADVTAISGSVANTATIAAPAGTTDNAAGNNSATDTNTVNPAADLTITKTNSVSGVTSGSTTAYSVVVSNAGPNAANNALFQDPAVTGLSKTTITCTASGGAVCPTAPISVATVEGAGIAIPTLPSSGSVTFTVNANVTAVSGNVTNTATVSTPAGVTEINAANNSASDTDAVALVTDVSVTKTDGVSSVNAGGSTTYTVVVSNAGPSTANGTTFQDAAVAGLSKTSVSCAASGGAVCPAGITISQVEAGVAIATLPNGGSVTFTIGANVTATTGSVANTATVTAPAGATDNNTANNSATDTNTVNPIADLAVTKTDAVSSVGAGGTTTYTVVVTNNGPSAADGATFQDAAATGLTKTSVNCAAAGGAVCPVGVTISQVEAGVVIPTLPNGSSVTFTIAASVTAVSGSVANTATMTAPAGTADNTVGNNSATDTNTVTPSADLVITKTGTTTAKAGDVLTYTLKVWNKGPSAVTDAAVSDIVPNNVSGVYIRCTATGSATCGSVTAATSGSNTRGATGVSLPSDPTGNTHFVTYTITGLAYSTGSFTNTATVSSATATDANPADNSSSQATTITVDAPITTGSPANQCSAGDTVNVLTPLAFTSYVNNHTTQVTNLTVNNAFTSYGTGTNGGIVLNGRVSWSYGIPRITGATLRVNVNGTTYAVLTTVGASSNPSQATMTALNGASVTPTTIALGSYNNEATAISFSLTLPTTVTSISSANLTFNNTSPTGSTSMAGDDIGVAIDSAFQCLVPPTLNVVQTNTNVSSGISDFYTYTTGIVGVKEVSMSRDYDQNSSQSTTAQTVSATTYSMRNAVIGTTPSNHINDYDVRLVCTNSNTGSTSVMPNDATTTTRTLPFDTSRSITLKRGDAVTCTWTNDNSFPRYVVSGRVFNDNSGSTGVAANAYNAVQDSGENGLANSAIQLSDCAGGVLATDSTDATGDYDFVVSRRVRPNQNICITEQNLSGYSSVSGVSGYNRATDTITVLNPNAASSAAATNISAQNFGDARLGLILTSDGQQTTTPGGTVSYPHILRAESVLTPILTTSTTQQPNNAADQLWTSVLYRDSNCNGVIDPSETPVGSLGTLLPNQEICVVQRVNAPTNASNGAQHVASLSASYVATVQGGDVLSGNSDTRKDTTLVGTGGLDMSKQVRVVSSCPSGDSSNTGFATQNTAKNGQFLEYQIVYKNRSTRNLSEVVIRDVVPTNTLFKSAQCQVTPSGSSCAVEAMPAVDSTGDLRWRTTGPVAPNAEGAVRFCVQVPPLQ